MVEAWHLKPTRPDLANPRIGSGGFRRRRCTLFPRFKAILEGEKFDCEGTCVGRWAPEPAKIASRSDPPAMQRGSNRTWAHQR
jgi:hypothetical protein